MGRFVGASGGVLEGLTTGKSTLVGPSSVGAFVGDLVGALVGPLVGPLVAPLVVPLSWVEVRLHLLCVSPSGAQAILKSIRDCSVWICLFTYG